MSGYEFWAKCAPGGLTCPRSMLTAYATPKLAVEAIKAGAMDYLAKPFAPEELLHAVGALRRAAPAVAGKRRTAGAGRETSSLDQIMGESPAIREIRELIQTVAPTEARVLILGESGTGKELVAGALTA